MKIHILSDIHLEFSDFRPPHTDADVVILAGDIGKHTHGIDWAIRTFWGLPPWDRISGNGGKILLYVLGNHEAYYAELHGVRREIAKKAELARSQGAKVWFLDNQSIELDGVRFCGCTLWTDYQLFGQGPERERAMRRAEQGLNDHQLIRCTPSGRFTPAQALSLHNESVEWLTRELDTPYAGKTIVITHHLPSMLSVAERFKEDSLSPAFASNLDALVERADCWVHGHTHENMDYQLGRCRVICNPRGYVVSRYDRSSVENPDFDPGLVVDTDDLAISAEKLERDQRRRERRMLEGKVWASKVAGRFQVNIANIPEPYRDEFLSQIGGAFSNEPGYVHAEHWREWLERRFG